MIPQLFFNKKDREYCYISTDNKFFLKCCKCHKTIELNDYFFIHRSFSKKSFNKYNYCPACISLHKKRIYDDFITARYTNVCPANSILIRDFPPALRNASASTFEMALSNKGAVSICDNVRVINNTKLSNNPGNMIMSEFQKAKVDFKTLEAENKGPVTKKYINVVFNSTPLIEEDNKKLIGGDNGKTKT